MAFFEQISSVLKPKIPICIPSPFKMLASLAHHFATQPDPNAVLSEYYASEALTPEVLNWQSSDSSIMLVRRAIQDGEDVGLLMRLLCHTGADLWSILESFSVVVERENMDEELLQLFLRLRLLRAIPHPESELTITQKPMEISDPEKGRKIQGTLLLLIMTLMITRTLSTNFDQSASLL
jgi:hypothetical protein